MNNIFNFLDELLGNKIIIYLLALDTIRALVAMLGFIRPESKLGRIIYGRHDRNLIVTALKDMGYSAEKSDSVINDLRSASKKCQSLTGVKKKDAGIHLIILLAKYIDSFDQIRYGGNLPSDSKYYIDTMEISHCEDDLKKMAAIMIYLIKANGTNILNKTPDVILAPKGGNPLLVQAVATNLGNDMISVKASNDKSRATIIGEKFVQAYGSFKINYEGSWKILNNDNKERKFSSIIIDCNTSGGSQLIDIIKNTKELIQESKGEIKLIPPSKTFVLFCVDKQGEQIGEKFKDCDSELIRFFDLDEEVKKQLYDFKKQCEENGKIPDFYLESDRLKAQEIIETLKSKGKYYYKG